MCGRFVLCSPAKTIIEEFRVDKSHLEYIPSYNIAPTRKIVIVRKDRTRILTQCRWGFVPSWAKDPGIGNSMIHARAETVADKPAFRDAFKNQRCLVVADGFYEWKKGKTKTPVYIRLKSARPFGFAGLYNVWTSPEGEEICTCTIITTEPNEIVSSMHDRMPAIISRDDYDCWLDPDSYDREKLMSLLRPYSPDEMEWYSVSKKVNSAAYDAPDNILPAE
ncbi:MAG: SOS response-associated peptidase [Nitrospirae bacterium]|nr:SOS response-associated peptidase [Nitrospirota bacterium]